MINNNPLVTVLMPVYNGEKYLEQAINSILNQTFKDFEFLIIDDGSTDNSVEIIKSFNDSRIKLFLNNKNLKLIATLNRGIKLANGKYIARMDCDDISLPSRLEKQVNFLERSPEVGVCGSWLSLIGERIGEVWKTPERSEEIKCMLLFHSVVWHATVVFRKEIFKKYNLYYDKNYIHAEDYNLWVSSIKYIKIHNIQEVLYKCRLHKNKVSKIYSNLQKKNSNLIRYKLIYELGINPSKNERLIYSSISNWEFECSKKFIKKTEDWLIKLKSANKEKNFFKKEIFNEMLSVKWHIVCKHATGLGLWTWKTFHNSPLRNYKVVDMIERSKFFIKCLIKRKALNND